MGIYQRKDSTTGQTWLHTPTVNETGDEGKFDENEDGLNHPDNLAQEAGKIGHDFSQHLTSTADLRTPRSPHFPFCRRSSGFRGILKLSVMATQIILNF